jgi:hypothetical protein
MIERHPELLGSNNSVTVHLIVETVLAKGPHPPLLGHLLHVVEKGEVGHCP